MRVAALLVCAITAALGREIRLNTIGCPVDYTIEKLIPHSNCNKYYQCFQGTLIERTCSDGLIFNEKKNFCDWAQNVECNNQITEESKHDNGETENQVENQNNSGRDSGREKCKCNPKEASQICAKPGSDDELIAHEHCNKFYKCTHGKNVSMRCPGTLLYNPYREWCDFPENVKCGDRVIPEPGENEKETELEDNTNNGAGNNDNGNNNNGPCNCVPGEAPSLCAKSDSDGVLVAHEHCNKFYKCTHGKNISMRCPKSLLYNPYKEWCDFPENVKCGDRVIPDPEEDEKETEQEDNNNGGGDNDNGNNNNGPCNCVPGEAPSLCAKSDSDGVLVAHEHCNKFYKCTHGKNISMRCPKSLLYNPYKEWCDFPENVKCGDRVIPDPEEDEKETEQEDNNNGGGDNDNGNNNNGPCNCVPGEAPSLCAKSDSDGVLVAHEHCNKFYKCTHGKNISMRCPGTLLYNPYREWCDFPENVKCGDRVIPDPEKDEKETEQEDNNNGGGDNDNGNNNNGPCNCVPGEAPSLCAKSDSDGVLVAHEHCNKFYKCTHGKNISMRCPKSLLYNPYKEWCDYPQNVKCGDRVIPDPEEDEKETEQEDNNNGGGDNDNGNNNNGPCNCVPGDAPSLCAKSNSDGVLVAHEHCNKFYKCTHGKNISMRCPGTLLYNPYREWCDFPENVKCGDRVIPDPEEDEKETEQEDNNNGGGDNDNGNNNNGPCNCVPGEAPSLCAKSDSDGVLVAHEHCNKFYKCTHGKNISMRCPKSLLYNPYKEWCDFPENVKCGDRVIPEPEEDEKETEQEDNNNGGGDNDNGNNNNGPCNCVPGEAPSLCAKSDSDGVLVAHEHCNKFYKCTHGKNVSMRCPKSLLYNPYREWCDFPENVKCGDRVIPDPEEDEKETEQEDNNNGGGDNDNGNNNNGPCNCVPGEAPSLCAKSDSDGVLVAHEHCNKFYTCAHGKNVTMRCPGTLLYNPFREWCDFPENVKCGDRVIPDPEEDEKETEQENNNNNGGGDSDNGNNNNGPCNCVPGEAPSLCAKSDSDGVLVAHEHCNKFYKCTHGKNVSMRCPKSLLYNPYKEWCDYPQNVKCGDRVIPDPEEDEKETEQEDNNNGGGDNDNGNNNNGPCNCVPGEAPSLCAKFDSDGVLVAHEHCNKFYKCAHGKNVSMRCPGTLLYNPYREWCDFPENVKCGDRVIPDPEEDEKETEQENNNNNGGGDSDNGNNNNGPCNCVPGEAPSLCAKSDSDGVLVAHEHCNKFYKCTHGKNISMRCPGTLLYNPYREWCDFPENVKCGDRVIPDPEEDEKETEQEDNNNGGGDNDNGNNNNGPCNCVPGEAPSLCAKSDSDGVLVAHEHCNKFYKCTHGKNVSMRCPKSLLYNPYREWCDFPENVKCGDRVIPDPEEDEKETEQENNNNNGGGDSDNGNNNNGPCNCVPGEAPSLCAKFDSDGMLVAHEHCNKFYKCTHGKNVSMRCPKSLLYNPYKEWCDYPQNVKCGDRVIPDPEEDEKETEQEDNNNGGGDNDNGNNNNGPCNCVPGEAPSLCAKFDSDGVLVAHEHCNKFYKCTHGKNVSMRCPKSLLYNPYKEWCDYPQNVKCGDRIIPDPEEDEKETEQEDNNNGGGDNDNGNNNNGPCNCVPGEAPSLCAKSDSDGVLVAHEHCNKFYKCNHGKNVSMRCPKSLLYNPYREWCDYPQNVKCGDRVIPDPEEDEKETEQENNNNNGGGDSDNGNNNNGPCNCVPGDAPSLCAKSNSDGVLVAHEHCNKFYKCTHGKNISMRCPGTLLYNPYREWCDFPENVKCGDRVIPEPEEDEKETEQEDNNNGGGDNDNGNNNNGPCNCVPGEAPSLCAKSDSDGVLVAHEHCNKFYTCAHGKNVTMRCPGTLLYNPYREWCDFPENVKCGDRVIPDPEEDEKETEQEDNNNNGGGDNDNGNNNNGPCNCVPGEAPSLCAKSDSDGVLVAHKHCNKFYKCTHGKNISMRCPGTLMYNPYREWCDFPENVKCGDRVIPDPEEDEKETEQEDNNNGGGDNDNGNNNNGPCNCVPGEAPSLCAKSDSDGVLVAHEHCNKFYKCTHGKNVSMRCPKSLLYNPYREWCDFPENVKCGDRVIPDPEEDEKETEQEDNNNGGGDNDNGNNNNGPCNCVPGEAPSLCAKSDSDGVLVAHEHCNKFYKCTHGKNISMRCPGTLLYNPFREWCDFPENVKCGDRVIPDPEEDEKETEQENNNNNGGGDSDNGNNNNGPCNCVPGEAPSLCAKFDSDGVLVAHEHCNKFYKCAHGKNVSMRCPGTLLYNPYREWCDFPENVKCGDRVIPDPEEDEKETEQENNNNNGGGDSDNGNNNNGPCNCVPGEAPSLCAKSDSDGVLVAHEHCNKFYKCTHGKNISMRCPGTLLYNPYREWCDFPENVKCGDRVIPDPEEDEKETEQEDNNNGGGDNDNGNNNNGPCNCVPGEAPSLCAKSDSDGVLVAHEHCNKFYKCTHGKNVSMRCPKSLLYNPYREWCDFPENVKCGDRVIPDPEEDEKETEQENNNNNGGGDSDNGNNNNGPCNCVPGEAPSLCAKFDSDGMLVAHEHCNKFYKCTHGKNVSMRCPKSLLYNPYKEWCDYPQNVKCGDRVIPDPEEDEKETEQEDNNNGGGDNDNGNNNNGPCNCVPGEAPSLCAKFDSDGVLVAHEHCNKFYKCTHGKNVSMRCPKSLLYNPYKEWCDYPQNVKCGDRVIPDPEEDEKETEQEDNNNGGGDNDNGNNNNGPCNCVPGEAPSLCAKSDSDGVLVAHEHCNKFYTCAHGKNVTMRCPGTLLYNPYREWCDFPENVNCGDRVILDPEEVEKEIEQEDNNNNDGGDIGNGNHNNGPCNCVPGEAPTICAKSGMDGVLVAHEHCNKFYQCSHGKNVSMRCPGTLLYNPYREWCDYPANVKCGDRVIPDPDEDEKETEQEDSNNIGGGDNDNGNNDNRPCYCEPREAPIVCAKLDSDGVLVAHEHCNKFYQCSHGKNISMRCPETLLYNPFREFCDFPQNVKCGDRVIPDPDDDIDMVTEQEDNNDNNGSANCNPAEASGICAKYGSDGVLVAHEHCNMFYKCSHGKNIEMNCPENLLYNPFKEVCDFPANVHCGERIVQNNNGSCNCSRAHALVACKNSIMNGITMAHEKCNHFYVCSHGNPVEFTCPQNLLFNTKTQVCDWPNVVDCGERITNPVAA